MTPFHIVLVAPLIPQNTGNIGRFACGSACHLHLIRPLGFDITDKALRRAGLDYWDKLKLTVHDHVKAYLEFSENSRKILITKFAKTLHHQFSFVPGDHLVFGQETTGLKKFPEISGAKIRLPMTSDIRSYNLANSVAMVGMEAIRQCFPEHGASGDD